jgi:hypothetical protein
MAPSGPFSPVLPIGKYRARELVVRMDNYVVAPKEKEWLSSPLEAFAGQTPQELIAGGRIRDLVVEFDRLREGQPV